MLKPSELILNADGSVYHLALRPEQVAPTVLLVGAPERVPKVSQHFDSISEKVQHRELLTHTGLYKSKPISVISTGMGAGGVDIVINEVDALVNIDLETREIKKDIKQLTLIRLGTCGALQDDIPLESLVMTEYGLGMDAALHYYDYPYSTDEKAMLEKIKAQVGPLCSVPPYVSKGDEDLLAAFTSWVDYQGMTCTSVGFYGPQARQLRAKPADSQLMDKLQAFKADGLRVANFDMEAALVLGLGRMLGHRCASISTVVAQRTSGRFCENSARAVEHLIVSALEGVLMLD